MPAAAAPPARARVRARDGRLAGGAGKSSSSSRRSSGVGKSKSAARLEEVLEEEVALSVDLEDALQAVKLLRRALDREEERSGAQADRSDASAVILARARQHKLSMNEALARSDELLQEKRNLSAEVKVLVEELQKEKERTQVAVSEVMRQADEEIQQAKVAWAEGEASRRERWLSRKTKEIREVTMAGLEPDIARIVDRHRAEMERLDGAHRETCQKLQSDALASCDAAIAEERARIRQAMEVAIAQGRDESSEAAAAITDRLREQLQHMRRKLSAEAETQRLWQNEDLAKRAADSDEALAREAASARTQMQALRERRLKDAEHARLQRNEALEAVRKRSADDRQARLMRAKQNAIKEFQSSRGKHDPDSSRIKCERDSTIDSAIRDLQARAMKFEDERLAQLEQGLSEIESFHEDEASRLMVARVQWTDRTAALIESRSGLLEQRTSHISRIQGLRTERSSLEGQLRELQRSMRAAQAAEEEKKNAIAASYESQLSAVKGRRAELEDRMAKASEKQQRVRETAGCEAANAAAEHDTVMARLHEDVKADIAAHEAEEQRLRALLHAEQLKNDHISRMLARYENHSDSN
jgi:5-azacytidine-induced protein 1